MGLNRYEIFLKVAEVGNITRAAELLHYTQAGVSHSIAALEREAGVPLLIRGSNGVTLTENGKRLIQPIQTLVNDQRALEQSIFEINEVVAGTAAPWSIYECSGAVASIFNPRFSKKISECGI